MKSHHVGDGVSMHGAVEKDCHPPCSLGRLARSPIAIRQLRLATPERKEEETLSREDGPVLIKDLFYEESLPGHLDEIQVSASTLLEAEVNDSFVVELQEVLEGVHQQGEGGLEVDALGGDDNVGLLGDDFEGERFAPVLVLAR